MKKIILKTLFLAWIGTMASSFATPGGEGFEIYLGKQLFVQHFGNSMNTVSSLQWTPALANEEMVIKYYHCGQPGKDRMITVKNAADQVIKQFHYQDAPTPAISLKMKVITDLAAAKHILEVKLVYSSKELPKGREILLVRS